MKDLSLFALDIAQNAITAGAKRLELTILEEPGQITLTVTDDGCGMSPALLAQVTDPFTTTRTTRKTGMGLPLLRMAAELTGGTLSIESQVGRGTQVTAVFFTKSVDCVPVGNMGDTLPLLVRPDMALFYTHTTPSGAFQVDTRQMGEMLGPDVPLTEPAVLLWLGEYVREQETALCAAEERFDMT